MSPHPLLRAGKPIPGHIPKPVLDTTIVGGIFRWWEVRLEGARKVTQLILCSPGNMVGQVGPSVEQGQVCTSPPRDSKSEFGREFGPLASRVVNMKENWTDLPRPWWIFR